MRRRVFIGLGLFLSVLVQADPVMVATESFPYANGSLIGRGPASGFIDTWQNQGSDASSGFNVSQGQAQGYGTLALYRSDLGATYGYPGTQIEFSYRIDFGASNSVDFAGIELNYSNSQPRLFMGKPAGFGTGNPGEIVLETGGGAGRVGTGVPAVGVRNLVTQISFVPGNDSVQLFVYDDAGTLLGQAVKSGLDVYFNQVLLVDRLGGARLDNVQIGRAHV